MGKTSVKKVISDVRDAYVDLTGDTDDITYGNISTKISEIETGGGEQVIGTKTIGTVSKLQSSIVEVMPTSASTMDLPITDVEATGVGTTIFVLNGNIVIEKATDDMCICGYFEWSSNSKKYAFFVSDNENAVKNIVNGTTLTASSFTWNNQTYYTAVPTDTINDNDIVCGTDNGSPKEAHYVGLYSQRGSAAEALLRYYYYGQS